MPKTTYSHTPPTERIYIINITPKKTRFKTPDYSSLINGFDGFEAIAFNGNKIYITIEAEHDGEMVSYLVWGKIDSKSLEVDINEKDKFKKQDHSKVDIIKILVSNPKLIERPIIENSDKAIIGRPIE